MCGLIATTLGLSYISISRPIPKQLHIKTKLKQRTVGMRFVINNRNINRVELDELAHKQSMALHGRRRLWGI